MCVNNMYVFICIGFSMSQSLPVGNFKWLSSDELIVTDIMTLDPDGPTGYYFQVDLSIPKHLHDFLSDYPPMPAKEIINQKDLSEYQRSLKTQQTMKIPKLLATLLPKKKYTLHYKCLQYYLSLGVELGIVHSGISFDQKPFLAPYIAFNTEHRKQSKSNTDKQMFKFLTNSLYGKKLIFKLGAFKKIYIYIYILLQFFYIFVYSQVACFYKYILLKHFYLFVYFQVVCF